MKYKPDYGLHLLEDGYSREIVHTFHDFRLYSLTVLGVGRFSTMVDYPYNGELHALSLDFNQDQLMSILLKAPKEIIRRILEELSRDPINPRTIDFEGYVPFGVRAKLGEVQANEEERFVPFIALEIS